MKRINSWKSIRMTSYKRDSPLKGGSWCEYEHFLQFQRRFKPLWKFHNQNQFFYIKFFFPIQKVVYTIISKWPFSIITVTTSLWYFYFKTYIFQIQFECSFGWRRYNHHSLFSWKPLTELPTREVTTRQHLLMSLPWPPW